MSCFKMFVFKHGWFILSGLGPNTNEYGHNRDKGIDLRRHRPRPNILHS